MSNYGIFNSGTIPSDKYGGFTYSKATNAISPDQNNTIDLTIGYDFYVAWILTDNKARVRGYFDQYTRTNDIDRSLNDTTSFPNNCIFDFIISKKFQFSLPLFFVNLQDPQEKKLYLTITNLEDSLKIIMFSVGCLETSNNPWLSLSQADSPYLLSKDNSKIILRDMVELQTDKNSLRNYLIYSQVSNTTFNTKEITPQSPLEALINYQKGEYDLFLKSKNLSLSKSSYLLYPDHPQTPPNTLVECNFQKSNSTIDYTDYPYLSKEPFKLENGQKLSKFTKSDGVFTFLETLSSSFSISLFSKKFTLTINKANISFNETISLPIVIDSSFTEVFNNVSSIKDIAVTDNIGNLKHYWVSLFDLTNQVIILNVLVDLDTQANTELTVYLSNSDTVSFETNISGFKWNSYFPLKTTAEDIIRSIGGAGSFSTANDTERGDYLDFDGSLHSLDLRLNPNYFQEYNQYTISMWVKPTQLTTEVSNHGIGNCLLAQSSDTENDILEIGIDGSSNILEIYQDTESQDAPREITTANTINVDTWTFIGIVSNPTEGYLRVNVNGEIKEETYWQSPFDNTNADISLATNFHTFVYYNGGIQNLFMSNRAISLNLFAHLNSLLHDQINFFNYTGVQNN